MKILHLIGGGDVGGAKVHVLSLVNKLSEYSDVKLISLRPGEFAKDAKKMGIDTKVIKTGNIFKDIKRVVQIIKSENVEIVHSHGAKANMISLISKIFAHVPTITTLHSDYKLDYMHSVYKKYTFGLINSIALRAIDYFAAVSDNFKKMLISRGFNPVNIFTIYNGMDFNEPSIECTKNQLSKKYNLNLKKEDIVVGIAARLYPVKGINTLIDAAALVKSENKNIKFVIGGDGEDKKTLIEKTKEMNLTNTVHFLGWLDDPYELMSAVDISVLTSISESFPYSILEGAKFKKATISTDVGGIPDLISNEYNGYLFKPGDHKTLAKYIIELAHDSNKRVLMGQRIHKKALEKFSLDNMCKSQLSMYEQILKRTSIKEKENIDYDVIISGYYGFENIGDDALLEAIIKDLKKYNNNIRIMVLSRNPNTVKRLHQVNSINRLSIFNIIRTMKKSRLFIYGGGTLIQESTSTRSLFYYLGIIWMAKKIEMKVMLYANGIEPINKYSNKKLTKKIVDKVDVITLREKTSQDELYKLGVRKPKIYLTADPALTIKPAKNKRIEDILKMEGIFTKGMFMGISVRKWQGYEKKYALVIAKMADEMVRKYKLIPLFIPMQFPSDLIIIEKIVSLMEEKAYIIKKKYSVSEMIGIIGKMDILIGMRLHALIFAANQNVPIVGMVYEPKVEWFLKYIKKEKYSAGHVSQLEYDNLLKLVDNTWQKRKTIKNELEHIINLKEKALQNAKIATELLDE